MPRQLAEAQPPLRADPDPLPPSCLLILGLLSFFSALLPLHRLLWNVITPLGNPLRATTQSARQSYPPRLSLFLSFPWTLPSPPSIPLSSLSLSLLLLYTVLPVTVGIVELSGWFRWNRVWGYCLSGIGNVAFQRSMKVLERSHRLRRISCTSYFKRAKCVINLLFIISQVWISRSFPNKWKKLI